MRKLALVVLVLGLTATSASAAELWMEFRGAGTEVTMAPSDYVTIDVWLTPEAWDVSATASNFDNFFVAFNVDVIELQVTSISTPAGWQDITVWSPNNPEHWFGDISYALFGVSGPVIHPQDTNPILLMDLVLHKTVMIDDVNISFTIGDTPPVPDIAEGPRSWTRWTFTFPPPPVGGFFTIGQNDLFINNIPEPASLALLALGGLAVLRRR